MPVADPVTSATFLGSVMGPPPDQPRAQARGTPSLALGAGSYLPEGSKSRRLTKRHASSAPYSRLMPGSFQSTDNGPSYPTSFSARISASQSTPPCPGERKSQP